MSLMMLESHKLQGLTNATNDHIGVAKLATGEHIPYLNLRNIVEH